MVVPASYQLAGLTKTIMSKPFYKSKEVWLALFGLYNIAANSIGSIPHIEPTDAFIAAIIGAIGAVRILYTQTKLTLK